MKKKQLPAHSRDELRQVDEVISEKIKTYLQGGHSRPKSRREFLASGVISMTGYLCLPTIAQLIGQSAWASECGVATTSNSMPAFINIQLAGGPALFANALACGNNGAMNLNYQNMGMPASPGVNTLFANSAPFWVEGDGNTLGSPMVRALRARIAGDTSLLNNSGFVAVAAKSVDDTANNPTNITGLLEKAGLVGSSFPYIITGDILAGFAQPAVLPLANMLPLSNLATLQNSLGFQGALNGLAADANASLAVQRKLVAAVEKLSKHQVEQLVQNPSANETVDTYRRMIACSTEKNSTLINGATNVNLYDAAYPGGNGFASVWALDQGAAFNAVVERSGHAVVNCLRGMSGAVVISLGGYDYHLGNVRADANEKDRQLGDLIGRILRSAKIANRKTFIYITADGSISTTAVGDPTANWTGDYGERGMHYIIAYDPAKAPSMRGVTVGNYIDKSYQLNHFISAGSTAGDGVVSTQNPIGPADAQALCASAVFLNYLSFAGQLATIDKPELAKVKSLLQSGVPTGGGDMYNYFLRIAS